MTTTPPTPASVLSSVTSAAFSAVARTGIDLASLTSWDPTLARPTRALVPVDVQALVVAPGADVTAVPIFPPLVDPTPPGEIGTTGAPGTAAPTATGTTGATGGAGAPDITQAMPPVPPFGSGTARPAGVYLHWAAPDGLTQTSSPLTVGEPGAGEHFGSHLPPLADRWLVVRVGGGTPRRTRGWVIESERCRIVDLHSWAPTTSPPAADPGATPHLTSEQLTAVAGGDPAWAAVYDAVVNRFAMYDDLTDLDPADATGLIAYLVCGWWSKDANDPLYQAGSADFVDRVTSLRWSFPPVNPTAAAERDLMADRATGLGYTLPRIGLGLAFDSSGAMTDAALAAIHPAFVDAAANVLDGQPSDTPRLTLLHGTVYGVLPRGGGIDPIPAASAVSSAVGVTSTEAFAAILAGADPASLGDTEQLVEAFSLGLISRLDAADGLVDVDEGLHASGFVASAGSSKRSDRLVAGDIIAQGAASVAGSLSALEQGVATASAVSASGLKSVLDDEHASGLLVERAPWTTLESLLTKQAAQAPATDPTDPGARTVAVAAEPWRTPTQPVVSLSGAVRSLRHGSDGRFTSDGSLACRVTGDACIAFPGLVSGADLVEPLGNGALPPECDQLLQELALDDFFLLADTAAAATTTSGLPLAAVTARLQAEHALRWDTTAPPGGKDLLRAISLRAGVEPSPLATTFWAQPWVPLFLEWQLSLRVDGTLERWTLDDIDFESTSPDPGTSVATEQYSGRSLLTSVAANVFAAKVATFLADEQARGPTRAVLQPSQDAALGALQALAGSIDVVSAVLSDLRPQLLGLALADSGRQYADASGNPILPSVVALPQLLCGGTAWFSRLRIVDAFGRTVELDPSGIVTGAQLSLPALSSAAPPAGTTVPTTATTGTTGTTTPTSSATSTATTTSGATSTSGTITTATGTSPSPTGAPAGSGASTPGRSSPAPTAQMMLRPRFTRPARISLDFVDASAPDGADPALAMVDQVDPDLTVSPLSGWLLPDHLDGSLEVFDERANPLGSLVEDVDGHVVWEGAPGIPGPVGAPPAPFRPGDTAALHVVRFAAGLVAADTRTPPGSESALAALLRTIDTTAWTSDPLGWVGTEHQSVLVGRPIAVLRMTVTIEVDDDLGLGAPAELSLTTAQLTARQRAYEALSATRLTVHLGELTRTDDTTLGYFVNDNYSRFTPVSPEVLESARQNGRLLGQLAMLGPLSSAAPAQQAIKHPYVDSTETPLQCRPGQTVTITLFMAPGGWVHATSGLLPRVRATLARDWIAESLKLLRPSFRSGPILVDPATIRLPKSTGLSAQQVFTARTDPSTWRDYPLGSATEDALLPDAPAVTKEGWLRVATSEEASESS